MRRFNDGPAPWKIAVTPGPLDTEALSGLASSSLLLGDTPFDVLLMDVSWTARHTAAGWLEPLDNAFAGHLWRLPLSGDTALLY